MAAKNFYTHDQIELAKMKLDELPDLSKDKISSKDALESLNAQIVALATQKGYSAKEIKSALETCEIVVSERAIRDLLSASSGSKKKAVGKNKKTSINLKTSRLSHRLRNGSIPLCNRMAIKSRASTLLSLLSYALW